MLGGPTIYPVVANFLWYRYMCHKLWKLLRSEQNYCSNGNGVVFLWLSVKKSWTTSITSTFSIG